MFKAHLASQLFTTLNLQLFRAIFPLAFLPLHIPLPFQTFRRNELINKSVYYLSTEVGNGFTDIIGIQQTVTLGVDHLALVVSHSLRLISMMCFDWFVTEYQKLNHYQKSQYRSS